MSITGKRMNEYFVKIEQREKRETVVKVKAKDAPEAKRLAEHKAARIQGLRGKVIQADFGDVTERSFHAMQVSGEGTWDATEYARALEDAVAAVTPDDLPPGLKVVIEDGRVNIRLRKTGERIV
jgi:hypothetical protein